MAVDHWWLGTTSTDHALAANWSTAGSGGVPGVSVPGTGDEVQFDGGGNNPCTLTANWAVLDLATAIGYTAKLDLATLNLTMDSGGDITIEGTGEFDHGSGSHSSSGTVDFDHANADIDLGSADWTITGGDWVVAAAGAWSRGTSTVAFAGTCTINAGETNNFYNLSVASGTATVSLYNTQVFGIVTLDGTLSLAGINLFASGLSTLVINDGGKLTGGGTYQFNKPGAGEGVTVFHSGGTIDITTFRLLHPGVGCVLAPGNYQSAVKFYSVSATNGIMSLTAAGAYQFDSLELETTSTGTLTLDNTAGPTSITVNGNLIFDRNSTGVITVNGSGQSTNWIIEGGVVNEGAATWIPGTGSITVSGGGAQDWDWGAVAGTIEAVDIDSAGGTVTFTGNVTMNSFTGTAGAFDPNGQTIETTGNFTTLAGFETTNAADVMNGCTIIVGGDLDLVGQAGTLLRLLATVGWTLTVNGANADADWVEAEQSDASGGLQIDALDDCIDGGLNQNWDFEQSSVSSSSSSVSSSSLSSSSVSSSSVSSSSVSSSSVSSLSSRSSSSVSSSSSSVSSSLRGMRFPVGKAVSAVGPAGASFVSVGPARATVAVPV